MESLVIHTGAPTVNLEDITSCISYVQSKIVTPIIKHMGIPICFLQEKFDSGIFKPNMRSLFSCQQIFAPNHFHVQLSAGILNV